MAAARFDPWLGKGWGGLWVACTCGAFWTAAAVPQLLRERALTRCPRCGEPLVDPAEPVLVASIDRWVMDGNLDRANQVLSQSRDRVQRVADLLVECPHCGHAIADEQRQEATRALLRILGVTPQT